MAILGSSGFAEFQGAVPQATPHLAASAPHAQPAPEFPDQGQQKHRSDATALPNSHLSMLMWW